MVKDYYDMLLYLIWMEPSLKSMYKPVYTVSWMEELLSSITIAMLLFPLIKPWTFDCYIIYCDKAQLTDTISGHTYCNNFMSAEIVSGC